MIALPFIRTPKFEKPRVLSQKLDNLLQECNQLSESFHLQSNLNRDFTNFNENLENLKKLSMTNTERFMPSLKIDEYVKDKFKSNDIPVREIMTTSQRSTRLSFEGYNENEITKVLSKQKRKFGEFWKDLALSFDSEEYEKLPKMELKPVDKAKDRHINKDRIAKNHKLGNMIRNMVSKKLGLRYTSNPVQSRIKIKKRPPMSNGIKKKTTNLHRIMTRARNSLILHDALNENDYLAPEYTNYLNSPTRRLKLEKILISQHQKDRKKFIMMPN